MRIKQIEFLNSCAVINELKGQRLTSSANQISTTFGKVLDNLRRF